MDNTARASRTIDDGIRERADTCRTDTFEQTVCFTLMCKKNPKKKTGYPKRSKKFDFFPAQDRIASIGTVLDARIKKKTKTTINKKKNYRVSAGLLASLRPKITLALDARQTHGRAHALTRV